MKIRDTTKKRLEELYEDHIHRYSLRLRQAESGKPGFRADELKMYISLWNEVKAKDFDYSKLTSKAKSEVDDAIFDEEE